MAYSPDGKRIVTAGEDGTVKVWDAATGQELLALKGHTAQVFGVAFSPDGRRIVTGSYDKTVKVWDARTGQEVLALKGHADHVPSVAFSPDGKRIVSGSADQTAKVWDAEKRPGTPHPQYGRRSIIAWRTAPTATTDRRPAAMTGRRRCGTPSTGQELFALKGHKDWVCSVAFSPDGKRIVTGSKDRTAKVWDAATGREVLTLKGHTAEVRGVAFSPDGKRIVSGACQWPKPDRAKPRCGTPRMARSASSSRGRNGV